MKIITWNLLYPFRILFDNGSYEYLDLPGNNPV
jgi:hypothetical protein